jgi:hypothetical protein
MIQIDRNPDLFSSWILLPPGKLAILRFPADTIPRGARLATAAELLTANLGRPFPWGNLPTAERASQLWHQLRIGIGGLVHDRWFVTTDGRFGGAPNVPQKLPGSLRCCMLLDGGGCDGIDQLADNEGYAVVREVPSENADLYRKVQMHAAEHVAADGGAIILTQLNQFNEARVGFVGRCQTCPNPELVSFRQLQSAVPGYKLDLLPEWKDWRI